MKNGYGKMLDSAFHTYYERFRELNALSKETAVTKKELFPNGEGVLDSDRMHKMLSMEIVKRAPGNRYWLDEKRASDPNAVLKQRIILIVSAIAVALVLVYLKKTFGF